MNHFATYTPQQFFELAPAVKKVSELTGFNSDDLNQVYTPLAALLLKKRTSGAPFIIGVSGSVAAGKSTTAKLFVSLINQNFPKLTVQLVNCDGFLYPNAILEKKHLMERKGFPESFDWNQMMAFLQGVKKGDRHLQVPLYSHETYDILPDKKLAVENPDVLILEGINVLEPNPHEDKNPTQFLDTSIYLDAPDQLLQRWFLRRFNKLRENAKGKPEDFYYRYAQMDYETANQQAKAVWKAINLKNLKENIEPSGKNAEVVLKKTDNFRIKKIAIKKSAF